jgi:hypothetical protein
MMISISMIRMISNDDARQSSQTEVKEDFSLHAATVPGLHNGQAARPSLPSDLAAGATSVTEAREGEKGPAFPLRAPRADTARERGAQTRPAYCCDLRPSCSGLTPPDTAMLPSSADLTDNTVASDKPTACGETTVEDTDAVGCLSGAHGLPPRGPAPRPPFSRESMILEGARAKTRKKSGKTRREKTF